MGGTTYACPTRSSRVTRRLLGSEIVGIRVLLSHGYLHIDPAIVDSVIDQDVPELRDQLQVIADSLVSSEGDPTA